jgi:hypothetical protein
VLIATPEHIDALLKLVPADVAAGADNRLLLLDAEDTLDRILVDGYPDWARFDHVVGSVIREAQDDAEHSVRAFGEMVGILWKARQFPAALRLEQLWHRLLKTSSFSLYCAYPVNVFGDEFDGAILGAVLSAHTHLLPSGMHGCLQSAVTRAVEEMLESKLTPALEPVAGWAEMPPAESTILWLRSALPQRANDVLGLAHRYYQDTA